MVGHGVVRCRDRNRVSGSGYAGFRAVGHVCEFKVADNAFASIAGTPVSLLSSGCTASQIVVVGNTVDGVALVQPVGASPSGTIQATGAVTATMPHVRIGLMQSPGVATLATGVAR